jgi:serine/threonine-protein phosphatase 6 catalytic subunit
MIDNWIELLNDGRCLPENDLFELCLLAKSILIEENNVMPVSAPVIICGDIKGRFYELLEIFKIGGSIPDQHYIFLGNYVDRGYNSVETFELLLALKVKYPQCITLLRGNHESRQLTQVYGFYDECVHKYGNANPWIYFTDVFDYLNIAAIIENKILCVHGGLSPVIRTLDQIRVIDRKVEISGEGAFCDLLWSDPEDIETWSVNPSGAGWIFGFRVAEEFNYINGLDLICRGHRLVLEGFKYWFPKNSLVTVYSCPNYVFRCDNVGAILVIDQNLGTNFKIFSEVPQSAKSIAPRSVVPYFL